jgi:hypothetical protein
MRRSSVGAALAILVFQVTSAFADPIAEWGGPWMVTFPAEDVINISRDDLVVRRAFGDVGFTFEALPGTQAWAKAAIELPNDCLVFCFDLGGTPLLASSEYSDLMAHLREIGQSR